MTQDFFLAQFKLWLMATIGFAGGAGYLSSADAGFATITATTFGPMIGLALWSGWTKWNTKAVPVTSTAIDTVNPKPVGTALPLANGVTATVVGALLLGILILGMPERANAQTPDPNGNTTVANSCDILTLLKGLTPQNFILRFSTCNTQDLQMAIDNANLVPVDNQALACYLPAQTIIGGIGKGGLIYKAQLFRRAKMSGLLANCTAWANSFIVP